MTLAKHTRNSALIALLTAATVLVAVAAHAEQDTFLNGPDDTFYIDQDGPDQDPRYDEDDPKYDELNDLDHEEDDSEEDSSARSSQTLYAPIHRIETFWI